jgi:hypothetical protein
MARVLSAALGICALSWLAAPALALPLTSGLEGYWQFEGDGNDSSTHGRDLTVPAGASYGTGLFGQALLVGGNEANAPTRTPFDGGVFDFGLGDFTIQFWVNWANTAAASGEQILLEKFTGGNGPGWTLTRLSNAQLLFLGSGAGSVTTVSPPNIVLGNWQQFVARRSGTDLRLFHNGGSVAFTTLASGLPITAAPEPLLLGARDGAQNFPLKGGADEVAIWSRALTNAEITALYNAGSGMMIPEPSTLLLLSAGLAGLALRRRFWA